MALNFNPGQVVINWTDPTDTFVEIEVESTIAFDYTATNFPGGTSDTLTETATLAAAVETATLVFEEHRAGDSNFAYTNHEITACKIRAKMTATSFGPWVDLTIT